MRQNFYKGWLELCYSGWGTNLHASKDIYSRIWSLYRWKDFGASTGFLISRVCVCVKVFLGYGKTIGQTTLKTTRPQKVLGLDCTLKKQMGSILRCQSLLCQIRSYRKSRMAWQTWNSSSNSACRYQGVIVGMKWPGCQTSQGSYVGISPFTHL